MKTNWPTAYLAQYARAKDTDATRERKLSDLRQDKRFTLTPSGLAKHDRKQQYNRLVEKIDKGQRIEAFWEKTEAQELQEVFEEVREFFT